MCMNAVSFNNRFFCQVPDSFDGLSPSLANFPVNAPGGQASMASSSSNYRPIPPAQCMQGLDKRIMIGMINFLLLGGPSMSLRPPGPGYNAGFPPYYRAMGNPSGEMPGETGKRKQETYNGCC